MDKAMLQTILPVVIIVVVIAFRLRSMAKPQPLRSTRLWIVPAILVLLGVMTFVANPPSPAGLGICALALAVGCALGWHRGKLIKVWRDEASGQMMQQASPAAMFLLLGIIAVRYVLRSYFGAQPGADGHMDPRTMLVTDALLAFAIGLIAVTRLELAIRTRSFRTAE